MKTKKGIIGKFRHTKEGNSIRDVGKGKIGEKMSQS